MAKDKLQKTTLQKAAMIKALKSLWNSLQQQLKALE